MVSVGDHGAVRGVVGEELLLTVSGVSAEGAAGRRGQAARVRGNFPPTAADAEAKPLQCRRAGLLKRLQEYSSGELSMIFEVGGAGAAPVPHPVENARCITRHAARNVAPKLE